MWSIIRYLIVFSSFLLSIIITVFSAHLPNIESKKEKRNTFAANNNCFSHNSSSGVMSDVTKLDGEDLLLQFQQHGCAGTPNQNEEHLRMLRCCDELKSITSDTSSFGVYDQLCSNLNLLTVTQMICYELNRNEPKFHEEFKSLLSSEEIRKMLGRVPYFAFHKTMVTLVYQHALRLILQVEDEIGFDADDEIGDGFKSVTNCVY